MKRPGNVKVFAILLSVCIIAAKYFGRAIAPIMLAANFLTTRYEREIDTFFDRLFSWFSETRKKRGFSTT
jgi:hypothetical protein